MVGISFLYPAFLFGLFATVVPIIIHLIHRKKSKTVEFPTLKFLRLVEKRIARRRRLEEIIVLILRILAFSMLALGLSSPIFKEFGKGKVPITRIIILDNSMSMNLKAKGLVTILERAKDIALSCIKKLTPDDLVAVVPLHPLPHKVVPSHDIDKAKEIISGIKHSFGGTPLTSAIKKAIDAARKSPTPLKDIILFSDFQKKPIHILRKSGILDNLPKNIRIYAVSPRPIEYSNLTINSVSVLPLPSHAKGHKITVSVSNTSFSEMTRTLKLFIEDSIKGEKTVTIPAKGTTEIAFFTYDTGDDNLRAHVELSEDDLKEDNKRYFVIPKREAMDVLVISDTPQRIARLDPAFYITRALNPSENGMIIPEVRKSSEASSMALKRFDAIILADTQPIPEETASALSHFLDTGGGILCFLSPATEKDTLKKIVPRKDIEIGEVMDKGENSWFSLVDILKSHPGISPLFSATPKINLSRPRFFRFKRFETLPKSAQILARFTNGDPALVEIKVGKGRLVIFPTTANPEWNDFAWQVSFLPFLHSMAHYISRKNPINLEWKTETEIEIVYKKNEKAPLLAELIVSGNKKQIKIEEKNKLVKLKIGRIKKPGIVTLSFLTKKGKKDFLVPINIDPMEGDLERGEWKGFPGKQIYLDNPDSVISEIEKGLEGISIADPLIALAILFLIGEGIISSRAVFRREEE